MQSLYQPQTVPSAAEECAQICRCSQEKPSCTPQDQAQALKGSRERSINNPCYIVVQAINFRWYSGAHLPLEPGPSSAVSSRRSDRL